MTIWLCPYLVISGPNGLAVDVGGFDEGHSNLAKKHVECTAVGGGRLAIDEAAKTIELSGSSEYGPEPDRQLTIELLRDLYGDEYTFRERAMAE